MPKLTKDQVMNLARLSRLELTNEENSKYQEELNAILEYVEQLESINVEGFQPVYQVGGAVNTTRADEIIEYQASPSEMVRQAPENEDGYIKVGRMIG